MTADATDTTSTPGVAQWIDELPDGVLVCSPDGSITVANARLAEMSGIPRERLLGMNVDELVPAPQRGDHAALRAGFVDAGTARPMGLGMHLSLSRCDGELVPVEVSLSPLPGDGSRGVIAIVRDVSERLRAESILRTTSDLLTLADERERIARDLHDTVLQRLFGLGLELQALAIRAGDELSQRIEETVDEIDLIIREIRTAVFTLGSGSREGSLGQELNKVTLQAKRVLGFSPRLRMDGPVESAITPEIRTELLASLREALTNVARHSGANEAEIELFASDTLVMRVLDNGRGVPQEFDTSSGNGLRNMAERARLLGGDCSVSARTDRGTELRWWVPLLH